MKIRRMAFVMIWAFLSMIFVSTLQAEPTYTNSTPVKLVIQPYGFIDIEGPLNITVPEPGKVPENGVVVMIGSNFKHNVKVNWKLSENWPQSITTHDSISGSYEEGVHKGKIWLEGITTIQDPAGTYEGLVIITISPIS